MSNKAYLVMELYYACCYMSSRPHKVFKDKAEAEQYVKEGNESEEGKKFIEKFSWEDVEFKFFVQEIELL